MSDSTSHIRQDWPDIPHELRTQIDEFLGSPVVTWSTPSGGFSPGPALRVVTREGRRAFIKAIGTEINPDSIEIHRAEARIARVLPPEVPAARFQAMIEASGWVAIILDDVEGRHPATPWSQGQLIAVLDSLMEMTANPISDELRDRLEPAEKALESFYGGWQRNPAAGVFPSALPEDLREWVATHLPELIEASERATAAASGDHLIHNDLRADNILITPGGSAVFVDWPWASYGVRWLDALCLLVNVLYYNPDEDVEGVIASHHVFADMSTQDANDTLTGLAGYFIDAASQPPAPGIPTLRRFQLDQGIVTLRWLQSRLS